MESQVELIERTKQLESSFKVFLEERELKANKAAFDVMKSVRDGCLRNLIEDIESYEKEVFETIENEFIKNFFFLHNFVNFLENMRSPIWVLDRFTGLVQIKILGVRSEHEDGNQEVLLVVEDSELKLLEKMKKKIAEAHENFSGDRNNLIPLVDKEFAFMADFMN